MNDDGLRRQYPRVDPGSLSTVVVRARKIRPLRGRGRAAWSIAGSLSAGALAAALLALAPFIPPTENGVTGGIMLGFSLGWALIAVWTSRIHGQPQTWALVPAVYMATVGILLLTFGDPARRALSWIWPPLLLVLTVWLILTARRQLGSRVERALIYPVVALLVLAALGGGFEAMSDKAAASLSSKPGRLIDVGGAPPLSRMQRLRQSDGRAGTGSRPDLLRPDADHLGRGTPDPGVRLRQGGAGPE